MPFSKKTHCQENLITERDELRQKLKDTLEWKDSVQNQQSKDFNELLCRDDTLCRDFNRLQKELNISNQEHNRLLCENDELDKKLNEQRKVLEELKCLKITHQENAKNLQKQYLDIIEIRQKLQNKLHEATLKKNMVDKDLTCVQKKLTEQINIHADLDKTVSKQQDEKECLVSSINELKIDIEKLSKSNKTESLNQQNQLSEKTAQLNMIIKTKNDKTEEIKTYECQIATLNTKIKVLQENYLKEKSKLDLKNCELKAEINSLTSKLDASNEKLCDIQSKNTILKNHLNNQENMIKLLESTKEKIIQELKKIKNTTEKLTTTITALSQLREKEKITHEKKIVSKNQEKCKLKELIKIELEQINKLQNRILDIKMDNCASENNAVHL